MAQEKSETIVEEEDISFSNMPFSYKSMFSNILVSFIKECPGLVAAFLSLIVVISLVNAWLLPTAQGKFIDKLKNATPENIPWIALAIFLVLYLIERSLQLGMMYVNQHMMPRFIRMVRMKFFRSTVFEFQRQSQEMEESEFLTNLAAVPWAINTAFHYIIYVLALQSQALGYGVLCVYRLAIGIGWCGGGLAHCRYLHLRLQRVPALRLPHPRRGQGAVPHGDGQVLQPGRHHAGATGRV